MLFCWSQTKHFPKKKWKTWFIRYSTRKASRQGHLLKPAVISAYGREVFNKTVQSLHPSIFLRQISSFHYETNRNYKSQLFSDWRGNEHISYELLIHNPIILLKKKENYVKGSFSKTIQNSRTAQSKGHASPSHHLKLPISSFLILTSLWMIS